MLLYICQCEHRPKVEYEHAKRLGPKEMFLLFFSKKNISLAGDMC